MLLSGVYLFAAGVWLVSLGESSYYANAGIAMRVIAWLVWRGTARALLYTPCCFWYAGLGGRRIGPRL